MIKTLRNFQLFLSASVLLMTIFIILTNSVVSPKKAPDIYSCKADSECVVVAADGCGCSAGGSNMVINKNFRDQWVSEHPSKICVQMMRVDFPCTESLPKCVENKCQFVHLQP